MKSNKIVVKLMAGVIIAGVTLSAGTTAFANTKDKASSRIQTRGTEKREVFKQGFFKGDITSQLDTLVKDGTITQAQKDKVVEYMNKKDETRKAEMEKVKAMTEEERKAYFETNTAKVKIEVFKELIDGGILTQAQADKVKAALPQGRGHKIGMRANVDFATAFDTLVKDGTITQAQEDKMVEFVKVKTEARKAEMEKIKAMTEEERKAYFETNAAKVRIDLFKELVEAGILNQAQADAAKKLLPQHKELRGDKTIKIRRDKSTTLKVAQ